MAVSSRSYSTVSDVEVRVGDLVSSRTFTTGTTPTKIQVEGLIDQSAGELNMTLARMKYTTPVTSAADPDAHLVLKAANADGASARILATLPAEAFAMNVTEEEARGRGEYYQRQFNHVLKTIRDGVFEATRSRSLGKGIMVGSAETRSGVKKLPYFERGAFEFPGTGRRLKEESTST
jgi:hypothetical protein